MADLTRKRIEEMLAASTTGPWYRDHLDVTKVASDTTYLDDDTGTGWLVAEVCGPPWWQDGDADLIAAAPDLAKALLQAWQERDEARGERAKIAAWLRRPVDEAEAAAWVAREFAFGPPLERRFSGGDTCWSAVGLGIVAYDYDIARSRRQIADAIERGEHNGPDRGEE